MTTRRDVLRTLTASALLPAAGLGNSEALAAHAGAESCGCNTVLTQEQRTVILDQAILLLEANYVHLSDKRKRHNIDPVARLKELRERLIGTQPLGDTTAFHDEVDEIFTSARDRHLRYARCDSKCFAYLPFDVRQIYEQGKPLYVAASIDAKRVDPEFRNGVRLVTWNGLPINAVVQSQAALEAGSTMDACRALALQTLTTRTLRYDGFPREEKIKVGFSTNGEIKEHPFAWTFVHGASPGVLPTLIAFFTGLTSRDEDPKLALLKELREIRLTAISEAFPPKPCADFRRVELQYPKVFEARDYTISGKPYGYIRIHRFDKKIPEGLFEEVFVDYLHRMPEGGLILDIRDNPGGWINSGERLLQTLPTKKPRIKPETFDMRNTRFNADVCQRDAQLRAWWPSVDKGWRAGIPYSERLPKTDEEACNVRGMVYKHPVVLVTDALTYSAGDIFAAGFQDHEIGPVLGVHPTTGGGGAAAWSQDQAGKRYWPGTPYQELPEGVSMMTAHRRSFRVYKNQDKVLEDAGVRRDAEHLPTLNDVLNCDADLIAKAASLFRA
ncbi:MAG TPA: S41 family peptidase [Burkholderiales bacterium]|nr:S41 family peptidase [Burkholderiales bacterium]